MYDMEYLDSDHSVFTSRSYGDLDCDGEQFVTVGTAAA